MQYSEKLNGYWEEGYHYYLEFRNEKLIVRDYRRAITLETTVSYDADSINAGNRTIITLEDNVLSRTWEGKMMTEIKELAYENGELKLLYYYTIMGETLYTLTKKDKGPFDHIKIRDDEFITQLQGEWEQWGAAGTVFSTLTISGNTISWLGDSRKFHAVSYEYDPDNVYLVPENLIDSDFAGFNRVHVLPDILTTTMLICDMSMPLSVFARKNMLDKIQIPPQAKVAPRNMMCMEPSAPSIMAMGMGLPQEEDAPLRWCSSCGARLTDDNINYCSDCGAKIKK